MGRLTGYDVDEDDEGGLLGLWHFSAMDVLRSANFLSILSRSDCSPAPLPEEDEVTPRGSAATAAAAILRMPPLAADVAPLKSDVIWPMVLVSCRPWSSSEEVLDWVTARRSINGSRG